MSILDMTALELGKGFSQGISPRSRPQRHLWHA